MDYCMFFVLDGVSVMIGYRNGFVVKFKEVNKNMIFFYCICYKLVLVCIDIFKELDYISLVQDYLRIFWKYFENFLKRMVVFFKV